MHFAIIVFMYPTPLFPDKVLGLLDPKKNVAIFCEGVHSCMICRYYYLVNNWSSKFLGTSYILSQLLSSILFSILLVTSYILAG